LIKRCIYIIILSCLIASFGCDSGDDPPNRRVLNVPYHYQLEYNFCAAAAIQMWAHYDSYYYPQYDIASYIGALSGGVGPYDVEDGVRFYTASSGYVAYRYLYQPGSQGDLIAACIEGVKNYVPAIMPFYSGTHAILVTGFEWYEDINADRPIAEMMYYNDPDPFWGESMSITGTDLDFYFGPAYGIYYVIIGESCFDTYGTFGHDGFVLRNGTYYGGPSIYDPKGLLEPDPDPNEN